MDNDSIPGTWSTSLTPAMIARQPTLSVPRVSPDGTRVAHLSALDARTDLHTLDRDGRSRQISVEHAIGSGSFDWSPDSSEFVFTSAADGKLWICPSTGGQPRRLTRIEGTHHSPRFSPDGRYVVFLNLCPESVDLMVVSVDGCQVRQISRGSDIPMAPSWSPDSSRLIWHAYPFNVMPWDESALMTAGASGNELPRVLKQDSRVAYAQPSFSPDGTRIVCVCDRGGWLNVTEMSADGSGETVLHSDGWEHGEPCYSPDGRTIVYTRNEEAQYSIWTVPSGGGEPFHLTSMPGHSTNPGWSPDGNSVVFLHDSPVEPADVWSVDMADRTTRRMTNCAIGGIETAELVMPETVTWSSNDGFEVHGNLFVPRDVRPGQHGCLVHIHGGPINQSRMNWNAQIQYFVQRGWVVIQPNYRGSLGCGRKYREALFDAWGDGDLQDNIGAIELCADRGLTRRDRVVAWGGSAGGYSTFICMTKAPDVFAGGVALYGLTDIYPFGWETHRYERYYIQSIMGPSDENHRIWWERSPVNFVDRVRSPMLILQGDSDPVVSHAQSDTFVHELKRMNRDFEYIVYEGEGHGFRQIRNIIDSTERIDRFLRQKILRDPEPRGAKVMPYPPMPRPTIGR
ncbi:MAG: S9 family peptidase [Nitrolancea sp.]